eukprot:scaffold56391_cov25-Phaeocystis_antarctica.AAC.1
MTPELPSKPSISVRIWLSVCSRSSLPPPPLGLSKELPGVCWSRVRTLCGIPAAAATRARAAHRVDLVDEDDARRVLLGLIEVGVGVG